MKIENAAVALLLLIMLITILCGGINLYRCRILPHWWSDVCCAILLLDFMCNTSYIKFYALSLLRSGYSNLESLLL